MLHEEKKDQGYAEFGPLQPTGLSGMTGMLVLLEFSISCMQKIE